MSSEASIMDTGSFLCNVLAEDVAFVVETYLCDTPLQLRTMREALADGDLETIGRAARALRSSSDRVGATAVAKLAGKLHTMVGYRASPGDVPPLVAGLEAAFAAVAPRLLVMLRERNSVPAPEPLAGTAG